MKNLKQEWVRYFKEKWYPGRVDPWWEGWNQGRNNGKTCHVRFGEFIRKDKNKWQKFSRWNLWADALTGEDVHINDRHRRIRRRAGLSSFQLLLDMLLSSSSIALSKLYSCQFNWCTTNTISTINTLQFLLNYSSKHHLLSWSQDVHQLFLLAYSLQLCNNNTPSTH